MRRKTTLKITVYHLASLCFELIKFQEQHLNIRTKQIPSFICKKKKKRKEDKQLFKISIVILYFVLKNILRCFSYRGSLKHFTYIQFFWIVVEDLSGEGKLSQVLLRAYKFKSFKQWRSFACLT